MSSNNQSHSGNKNDKQDKHGQARDASPHAGGSTAPSSGNDKAGKQDAHASGKDDALTRSDSKHTTSIGNAATGSTPSDGLTGTAGSSGS